MGFESEAATREGTEKENVFIKVASIFLVRMESNYNDFDIGKLVCLNSGTIHRCNNYYKFMNFSKVKAIYIKKTLKMTLNSFFYKDR